MQVATRERWNDGGRQKKEGMCGTHPGIAPSWVHLDMHVQRSFGKHLPPARHADALPELPLLPFFEFLTVVIVRWLESRCWC